MGSKAKRTKQAQKPRERLEGSPGFSPYDEGMAGDEGLGTRPEKSPGRPTVPDNIMWGRLNEITNLFETNWADIGWQVERLRNLPSRSPDDVRKAFEPLQGKYGYERITFLLRPTSITATSDEVRKTLVALGKAREELRNLQQQYEALIEKYRLARRAVYDTSRRHALELKTEITRRLEIRTRLRDDFIATEKYCTAAERKLATVNVKQRRTAEGKLSKLRAQLESCRNSLLTEENIIDTLKKHLGECTDQNRALARAETKKRVRDLKVLKGEVKRSTIEVARLQSLHEDQASGFAKQDLARFLGERRARHDPRQLAKAVAGLPEMGCRESFEKCRRLGFHSEPQLNFQVFEVIARGWARRSPNHPANMMDLVNESIERVPKTRLYRGERVPNYLVQYLQANRLDLEQAVISCSSLKPPPHPGELPYVVTRKFLANVARPRTTLERVRTQREEDELGNRREE
jgi:hypothetical protein